jgi:putative ABC transport system permease protein
MRQALSRSLRSLRRAPGFVAIATLSLGAALGLSTSVFALIDAMRHPTSPFRSVDQLYQVTLGIRGRPNPGRHDVEEGLSSVKAISGHSSSWFENARVELNDGMEKLGVAYTRDGYFDVLGLRPRVGRLPSAAESSQANVAVVSDALWRRRYDNRARTEGATLSIGDRQYSIIGVLPPNSAFAAEWSVEVWIPDPAPDKGGPGDVLIRASDKASKDLLQSQLNLLCQRWTRHYLNASDRPFAPHLISLRPNPLDLQDYHRAMIGAAICVLLIACANVAALMLARGMIRRRDYALRLALGAGRAEIAREVLVEVGVLALVGCVAGATVATWAVGLFTGATPEHILWTLPAPQWSLRVFALSAVAVIVSIGIAGGFPAWIASRTDPMAPLKESGGGTTGRAGTRFRWLVIAELALAMTIVVGASLIVKSAAQVASYDFGYNARALLSAELDMPFRVLTSRARLDALFAEMLERIKTTPGVLSAAKFTGCNLKNGVITTDRTIEGGAAGWVPDHCHVASAGVFATLGIPMVDGRDFLDGDDATGAIILDDRTARHLFPHERAVGRMLKLGNLASTLPWLPVVGVVESRELDFPLAPEMGPDTSSQVYAALPAGLGDLDDIIIRPKPGAKGVDVAVWRAMRGMMPPHSFFNVYPWERGYTMLLRDAHFFSVLFVMLGIASLALGAAGLFCVISYIAGQRSREFAVRIALGATKPNILRLVMKEALVMALGGTAIGAGLGMWAGFLLWHLMWGLYPVDASALIGGELTLLIVTMLACLVPALRATRANPVDVLRAA